MSVTIGIIKEGKVPIDRRVPVTPPQVRQMLEVNEVPIQIGTVGKSMVAVIRRLHHR